MPNRIEFRLSCAGRKELVYAIYPGTNSFETNVALNREDFHIPPCRKGYSDQCLSALNMLPIIVWFKKAISFDEVTLKLCRNNFCAFNTLPLSNAGFILSFYALVFSDCPCFSRYRYVIENTRISLDAKSFMFILLTSSAMHELFESDSTTMAKVIHDVKHSIRDIKETLHDVIQFSKSITEKDAMVNSLVSIFNLNMFAEMSLEQLIRDIRRNYFDGQPGTTPIRH